VPGDLIGEEGDSSLVLNPHKLSAIVELEGEEEL